MNKMRIVNKYIYTRKMMKERKKENRPAFDQNKIVRYFKLKLHFDQNKESYEG